MSPLSRRSLKLLVFYLLCHTGWALVLGTGFDSYKLLDFSHFLNPAWLKDDLLGSLIYLHAQPPLMNLLIGIIFNIAPAHYEIFFRLLYLGAGGVAILAIDRTLLLLGVRNSIRTLLVGILAACPTFYIYSTWYSSTHLEFSISAVMFYQLARYCLRYEHRPRALAIIFMCFGLLGLIRPQWHLILFVALAFTLAMAGGTAMRKKAAIFSLIFLLPVGGWYLKNQYVFGFFGGSSWMGANISQVAFRANMHEINMLKAEGVLEPDFPAQFNMPRVLRRTPPELALNIPAALGPLKDTSPEYRAYCEAHPEAAYIYYNLNYIGLIASARMDMKDAMMLIRLHPWRYAETVAQQYLSTAMAPSFSTSSLNMIEIYTPIYAFITKLGLPVYSLLAFAFSLYLLVPIAASMHSLHARYRHERVYVLLCFGIMLFMTITACAFNGEEQERMRWGWHAVYVLFLGILLERAVSYAATRNRR